MKNFDLEVLERLVEFVQFSENGFSPGDLVQQFLEGEIENKKPEDHDKEFRNLKVRAQEYNDSEFESPSSYLSFINGAKWLLREIKAHQVLIDWNGTEPVLIVSMKSIENILGPKV